MNDIQNLYNMSPKLSEQGTSPQAAYHPPINPHQDITAGEEDDGSDFEMRYRPHWDKYFQKPVSRQPVKHTLKNKWDQKMEKCPHPRWCRENFLGYTYFTCGKCEYRWRTPMLPMSFIKSPKQAEDWFEDCFPLLSSSSSSFSPDRPRGNECLVNEHLNFLGQEQHAAGVAKTVSAENMMQSETYNRITAQVHASTTKVNSEVQALACRFIAALQVCESRLTCSTNTHKKNAAQLEKQQNQEDKESDVALIENEELNKKEKQGTKKTSVPRLKVRDMVLGGYFYACVTLQQIMFVKDKVFHRLRLVHDNLQLMFPGLSRDLPTLTYLEALIPRFFPHLNNNQMANFLVISLDWIYSIARLGQQIPKRSLICCSLIAIAVEINHDLTKENVRFLQDFDCNYKKWGQIMSVLGQIAGKKTHHDMLQPSQPEIEKLLDNIEITKDWREK